MSFIAGLGAFRKYRGEVEANLPRLIETGYIGEVIRLVGKGKFTSLKNFVEEVASDPSLVNDTAEGRVMRSIVDEALRSLNHESGI